MVPDSPVFDPLTSTQADPEKIFQKLERIGKGSFGEVFRGYVWEPQSSKKTQKRRGAEKRANIVLQARTGDL